MNLWGDVVAQHFDGSVERLDSQQHKGQNQQQQGVQGGPQSIHHTCGCDQQQFAPGGAFPDEYAQAVQRVEAGAYERAAFAAGAECVCGGGGRLFINHVAAFLL